MKRSLHDIEIELTDLIYSSLAGEARWEDFLAKLASISPEGKASLFFHDSACSRGSFALSAGFTDEQVRQYDAHYSALNPWMARAALRRIGQGVVADQMLDHGALQKTEFYNDFLRPMGSRSATGITIFRDDDRLFLLSILTSEADADENRPVADLLTRLTVHLRRAFNHYRNAPIGPDLTEVGMALTSSNQIGFLIVGEGPTLKTMSPAAEKLIESGYGIVRSPTGKLKFSIVEAETILSLMLGRFYQGGLYASCRDSTVKLTFIRLQKDRFLSFVEGPTVVLLLEPMARRRHSPASL
ncbi:MAG: helix-turn-helix transcriptional regulator [Phyllobacterium sp.]